jgi:hypothetical protein
MRRWAGVMPCSAPRVNTAARVKAGARRTAAWARSPIGEGAGQARAARAQAPRQIQAVVRRATAIGAA